ncbi:hypothetical protein [Acetobacter syzygii]|uniref:hypothetical protein n=1 Tax=Acetobacter syzygii TaxID=146476 RepID=UPI0039E7B864
MFYPVRKNDERGVVLRRTTPAPVAKVLAAASATHMPTGMVPGGGTIPIGASG